MEELGEQVREAVIASGVEAYFVGGYVRDQILGRKSKDIDIVVVSEDARKPLDTLAQRLGWGDPIEVGQFGTAQVHGQGFIVEAVRARAERYALDSRKPTVWKGTLLEDITRRDFTINTLCRDMKGQIVDLTGTGMADLKSGVIRTPTDPEITFSEDPLRMLRAARFAAVLGFTI